MSPAHDPEPPAEEGGPLRPGGGTYPVRAAVTAQQPPPPPRRTPAPRHVVPHPPRHGSPRALITLILLVFALFTLVLLMLSVSGYIPDASGPAPEADAPATDAPATDGTAADGTAAPDS